MCRSQHHGSFSLQQLQQKVRGRLPFDPDRIVFPLSSCKFYHWNPRDFCQSTTLARPPARRKLQRANSLWRDVGLPEAPLVAGLCPRGMPPTPHGLGGWYRIFTDCNINLGFHQTLQAELEISMKVPIRTVEEKQAETPWVGTPYFKPLRFPYLLKLEH